MEAEVMKRILNRYESISGQIINFTKSVISFSPNTAQETRKEICSRLGVGEVRSSGKYLGLPMHIGRNEIAEFGFMMEKIDQKLQVWSDKTLPKAGKITLLKTAAQIIPNFWMNLLPI